MIPTRRIVLSRSVSSPYRIERTRSRLLELPSALLALLALSGSVWGQSTTWTGAASSDWFDPANWSVGAPTAAVHAVIPATITAPSVSVGLAETLGLTVQGGATLSVQGAASLRVAGSLNLQSGGTLVSLGDVDVDGAVTLGDGTAGWTTGSGSYTVGGNWDSSGGSATGAGTIVFEGAASATVWTHSGSLPSVRVAKDAGATLTMLDQPTNIAGGLTIASGACRIVELHTNAHTTSVGGDVLVQGGSLEVAVTANAGALEYARLVVGGSFTQTGGATTISGGGAPDYAELSVSGDVSLLGGAVMVAAAPAFIVCGGNWVSNSGIFDSALGEVTFIGAGNHTLGGLVEGDTVAFPLLRLGGSEVAASSSFTLRAGSLVHPTGVGFNVGSHQVNVELGAPWMLAGPLSVGPGGALGLWPTAAVTVAVGPLSLIGTPLSPAVIRGHGGAGYAMSIDCPIAASNFAFRDIGPAGITIASSAAIALPLNDLRGGEFSTPSLFAGSSLLTIQRDSPASIYYAQFPNLPVPGAYNVRTAATGPAITFVNYGGAFAGGDYDDDPAESGSNPDGRLVWAPEDRTQIASFSANAAPGAVQLDWVVLDQFDCREFVVERALAPGGPFSPIHTVAASGLGVYAHLDAGLPAGAPHFYRLSERLDSTGALRELGTADATPAPLVRVLVWDAPLASPVIAGLTWPDFSVRIEDGSGELVADATDVVTLQFISAPGAVRCASITCTPSWSAFARIVRFSPDRPDSATASGSSRAATPARWPPSAWRRFHSAPAESLLRSATPMRWRRVRSPRLDVARASDSSSGGRRRTSS